MSRKGIFVDTGAWVALADKDDAHHEDAASILPSLLKAHKILITNNLVVAESYVLILKLLGHNAAIQFLDRINSSPRIEKIYSVPEIEKEAEETLKKFADQDFSYTDAVSFAIMKDQRIDKAFAFDKHFQTMGFTRLP
jgi:predicted nucleic acid-binding protein